MTDKEIQDGLRMAMQTLEHRNIPSVTLAHLQGLCDALEANPPLAEVEGWFSEEPTRSKLIILAPWKVEARYDSFEAFGATRVTVTIRRR